ncbi:serine/threonine protein kinase [Spirulina subsalsa FACHB-351]|uniref:Serine/threonine protein kinase n=1 Tax=Spirulina subsalsa FACHB-351 TaxID=234711 RepID=A0ABT3L5D4_9CYAN|nr:serine/threonine-protein kinase [Spirulina subsalsa]MCW6036709.1 serine/threonine protein kinase [Spirulina subsalsa FACHB-351]
MTKDPKNARIASDPNEGRVLANRYRLVELAGKGAMGHVYRAEDMLLGNVTVAVKFLAQTLLNQKMRDRFEREATICALLAEKSIHIVRVRDYGVDEHGVPYYVMEFLEGDNLSDIIKTQTINLPRFLSIVRQICLGLDCAHKGIVFKKEPSQIIHRDIKPSNILLVEDVTLGELVKILDFGIAKLVEANRDQTHSFMGTLAYCSPEQMEGKELDNRSDIYSFGVMMYEMLTKDMPLLPENNSFGGWYRAHHEFSPVPFPHDLKLPVELEKLVMSCLAKHPQERPQNMADILRVIEPLEKRFENRGSPSTHRAKNSEEKESPTQSSLEDLCLQMPWPENKPRQKIVFPRLLRTSQGVFPTLWSMLDRQDILNRRFSTRYNQFLFLTAPHPMLLWITVLYNREFGPRWLPCYLDLKTPMGQRTTRLLGESGSYRLLFFAVDDPSNKCQYVMHSTIDPDQCKRLLHWANNSHGMRGSNQSTMSKTLLRQEFEKLKPKILIKLESVNTDHLDNLHL